MKRKWSISIFWLDHSALRTETLCCVIMVAMVFLLALLARALTPSAGTNKARVWVERSLHYHSFSSSCLRWRGETDSNTSWEYTVSRERSLDGMNRSRRMIWFFLKISWEKRECYTWHNWSSFCISRTSKNTDRSEQARWSLHRWLCSLCVVAETINEPMIGAVQPLPAWLLPGIAVKTSTTAMVAKTDRHACTHCPKDSRCGWRRIISSQLIRDAYRVSQFRNANLMHDFQC